MFKNLPKINHSCSCDEIFRMVHSVTAKWNIDNISRTNAYFYFFQRYPEIEWTFLASMVSRNAGYNMCDLEGELLRDTLSPLYRKYLFLTYERANFLIFKDVFPQLLLYHYSTILNKKMFHFLPLFFVSSFMVNEWECFWENRNRKRLMTSLIVNEQNVIQKPVIEEPFFQREVFHSRLFLLQDFLKMNSVVFPTVNGELYGMPVHQFTKLDARIKLGKALAEILFYPMIYNQFYQFASMTEHTGSRMDYEQYFLPRKSRETPFLRTVYPIVNHPNQVFKSWDHSRSVKKKWFVPEKKLENIQIKKMYELKRKQLKQFSYVYRLMKG